VFAAPVAPAKAETAPNFLPLPSNRNLGRITKVANAVLILTLLIYVAVALLVHESGHLLAARACDVKASELSLGLGPKLLGIRVCGVLFSVRALPLGSFVRLDGTALHERRLAQQLLVHLGGVCFNLAAGLATFGSVFGWINLLIAAGNLLPVYQHDGWKCGVVLMRALLKRKSQPVEWAFTFSGGFISLVIVWGALRLFL
jgi:membrane-associated protease RseP (regulator of RpoE activity)